jgi:ferredoxin
MPDFSSGYQLPHPEVPDGEAAFWGWADVILMSIFLVLSVVIIQRSRSRKQLFILMLISLGYFGFFRKGCICPIGSLQIIADAAVNPGISVPAAALFLFFLPLLFTLFFGRGFCGAVCPLGALQDLVSIKHLSLPGGVSRFLGLLPPVYLALAVSGAVTGSDYLICRYDPFVGFFRFSFPSFAYFLYSAVFIGTGVVIHRPYCRFLCPYGFLLKLFSKAAGRHLSISPGECVDCRLCTDSCPQGCILPPSEPSDITRGERRTLGFLFLLLPVLIAGGWFLGSAFGEPLSVIHPRVRLYRELKEFPVSMDQLSLEAEAFLGGQEGMDALAEEAKAVLMSWRKAGRWSGVFLALVVFFTLAGVLRKRRRIGYSVDKGNCVSCGRCMGYCPQPHHRSGTGSRDLT